MKQFFLGVALAGTLAGCAGVSAGMAGSGAVLGSLLGAVGLSGNLATAAQAVCFVDGAYLMMFDPLGNPISVADKSATYVQAVCQAAGITGKPVALPSGVVAVPATVSLPTSS